MGRAIDKIQLDFDSLIDSILKRISADKVYFVSLPFDAFKNDREKRRNLIKFDLYVNKVCEVRKVAVISPFVSFATESDSLLFDEIHLSVHGYLTLARCIKSELKYI